jgi:hypothetical protein
MDGAPDVCVIRRLTIPSNPASLPQITMMRAIDAIGVRVVPA